MTKVRTPKHVQDVMTLCPHSVGYDQPLEIAKTMMREHNFRHLPVQSGGKIIGVVTERDLALISSLNGGDIKNQKVKDAFTPEPYVVTPSAPLREVASKMNAEKIGCALVEANGKVVGIFTTTDACRVLADCLS